MSQSIIDSPSTTIRGAFGPVRHRTVQVSSAQVLALFATPVTIVPAPGAGLVLIFEGALIHKPAGVAYGGIAAGEDLSIKYTDASGVEVGQVETTGFLDQTTAQTRWARPHAAASGPNSIVPVANSPFVLHLLLAEIITGDSPLNLEVLYQIVRATPLL